MARPAVLGKRVLPGPDHAFVVDVARGEVLAERPSVDRRPLEVEEVPDLSHQGGKTPGVVEVLHQVLAGGTDVGEHRG